MEESEVARDLQHNARLEYVANIYTLCKLRHQVALSHAPGPANKYNKRFPQLVKFGHQLVPVDGSLVVSPLRETVKKELLEFLLGDLGLIGLN